MPERDYVAAADASAEAATRNVLEAQREIAVLEKEFEDGKRNLSLYVEAETEHLRHLDAAKRKKAEALYHLESARIGRPPPTPGPQPIPQHPPRSAGPEMGAQPTGPIAQADTVTFRDPQTGQPVTSRIAPGFPVTAPDDAKATPEFKQWEGAADPRWSAADVIDERGQRHVIHSGRHLVFDAVSGKLLGDEPIQKNGTTQAATPPNGVG